MTFAKLVLKDRLKKFVLPANGNYNVDANSNNITLLSKAQSYMSLYSHYLEKTIKNCRNVRTKDLEDQFIRMNIYKKWQQKHDERIYILLQIIFCRS